MTSTQYGQRMPMSRGSQASTSSCRTFTWFISDEEDEDVRGIPTKWIKLPLVFIATIAPIGIIFILYSQMSPAAPLVMSNLATPPPQYIGIVIIVLSVLSAVFAAMLWYYKWENKLYSSLGLCCITAFLTVGISLEYAQHPVSVSFFLILLSPVCLYMGLEVVAVKRDSRWKYAATVLSCSAALCFITWSLWLLVRLPNLDKGTDWTPHFRVMVQEKVISWKVAFVSWALPLAISMELSVLSLLCWIRTSQLHEIEESDCCGPQVAEMITQVKQVMLALLSLMVMLWIGASVEATGAAEFGQERENFRDEVLRIAFFAFIGLCGWTTFQLGPTRIQQAMQHSKVVKQFKDFVNSDWLKGLVVLALAPVFVFFIVFPRFQKNKHLQGAVYFVEGWNWTGIIIKAQWWGALYMIFNVGFAKATVVLLASVNTALSSWSLGGVSVVIFLLGYFLFLLPPTPGVPVYMVTGIVIVSSALRTGWSFGMATFIAIIVGFSIKMAFAATAQKCIGEPLAQFVAIRHMVGVTTVEMRAIAMILQEPSTTLAKVAILIGGPDWPVAVLCGLLKLPLDPILIALCPVLFQSVIPCVLSGALLVSTDEQVKALGETALVVAGALQGVAAIVAGYYVQEVIEEHYSDLVQSRPEDQEVEKFAKASAEEEEAYETVTAWTVLPGSIQYALVTGLIFAFASIVVLSGPWRSIFGIGCFKPFSLVSSVDTDLGGNPWSIVLPAGWVGLSMYMVSLICFASFYLWVKTSFDVEKNGDSAEESP